MPADSGSTTQTARVEEGKDVEREETGKEASRVKVFERDAFVEPLLHEVELAALALREDHVEEALPL